jgi:acyl dehydratase
MGCPTVIRGLAAVKDYVGVELPVSDWIPVTQERIDAFANATDDHQWIHSDVARARRESPWKETIAHGYLTLSLAPALLRQILTVEGSTAAVNTGIEKMRLSSPVLAGSRVRLSAMIKHARDLPRGGMRVVVHLNLEVEGSSKPACTADVIYLYFDS